MVRIHCSCGKILKVDDALAGNRVKCPACSAPLVVPQPAPAAVTAQPPLAPPPDAVKVPSGRKFNDVPVDARPRRKQAPKQGNPLVWLLVGGGAAALVLVGLLGAGAWFLFFRGKPSDNPTAAGPAAGEQPFNNDSRKWPIKFFVPSKKGDKREVTLDVEASDWVRLEAPGADGDFWKDHKSREVKLNSKVEATLWVLAVNAHGEETRVEATITSFQGGYHGQNVPPEKRDRLSIPRGTVLIGEKVDDRWTWRDPKGKVAADAYMELDFLVATEGPSSDRMYGTDERKPPDTGWLVNVEEIKRVHDAKTANRPKGGDNLDDPAAERSGSTRLVSVGDVDGRTWLHLSVLLRTELKMARNEAESQLTYDLFFPADYATGPGVREVWLHATSKKEDDVSQGPGRPPVHVVTSTTVNIRTKQVNKYLANTSVPDNYGKDPGPNEPDKSSPFNLLITKAAVDWVPKETALQVKVDYAVVEKAKPPAGAQYTLYLDVIDKTGNKTYKVATLAAASIAETGTFGTHIVPVAAGATECLVRVVELKAGSGGEQLLHTAVRKIGGTPPVVAAGPTQVELSGAKVERKSPDVLRVTVDYKFTGGQPDPSNTYQLQLNLTTVGKASQVSDGQPRVEVKGAELQMQGQLVKEFNVQTAGTVKFASLWLAEATPKNPGKFTVVSAAPSPSGDVVAGAGAAEELSILFSNVEVYKNKGVVNGNVQFNWKVLAGQPNPKAIYFATVELTGGDPKTTKLRGPQGLVKFQYGPGKMPKEGYISQSLMMSAESEYQIRVFEQLPGQTQQEARQVATYTGKTAINKK
jgi:hypothetical protein